MQPLPARFLIVAEIRVFFTRAPELRRHVVKFARVIMARFHLGRVVHAGPRLGQDIGWVGVEEARPQEKWLTLRCAALDIGHRALAHPMGRVVLLGQVPGQAVAQVIRPAVLGIGLRRPGIKIVSPVGQPFFFQPERIVLAGVRFVGVHARRFHMVEAVPRPVKITPEIQIAHQRLALDRFAARLGAQRLEMRLAHQDRLVALRLEQVAGGGHVFGQFDPDRPAAVLRGVQPGDHRCPRGRAGRVDAVSPLEARALAGQAVQVRGADLGVDRAERRKMVLVGGNQENIGLGHWHSQVGFSGFRAHRRVFWIFSCHSARTS